MACISKYGGDFDRKRRIIRKGWPTRNVYNVGLRRNNRESTTVSSKITYVFLRFLPLRLATSNSVAKHTCPRLRSDSLLFTRGAEFILLNRVSRNETTGVVNFKVSEFPRNLLELEFNLYMTYRRFKILIISVIYLVHKENMAY